MHQHSEQNTYIGPTLSILSPYGGLYIHAVCFTVAAATIATILMSIIDPVLGGPLLSLGHPTMVPTRIAPRYRENTGTY